MKKVFIMFLCVWAGFAQAQGVYEWAVQESIQGGQGSSEDAAYTDLDLKTDATDNLYLLTSAKITTKIVQLVFKKYSASGQLLWHKGFNNIPVTGNNTYAYLRQYKITKHPQGYLLYGLFADTLKVDNITLISNTETGYAILIDSLGNTLWAKKIFTNNLYLQGNKIFTPLFGYWQELENDLSTIRNIFPLNITGNPRSNLYDGQYITFGGSFYDTKNFGDTTLTALVSSPQDYKSDGFLLRFDTLGNRIWLKHFTGFASEDITALHTDAQGNIYVVAKNFCYQCNFSSTIDGFTLQANQSYIMKVSANGIVLWVKQFSGSGSIHSSTMYNNTPIIGGAYRNSTSNSSYCISPSYPDQFRTTNDNPMCGYAGTIIHPNANDGWKRGYRIGGNYNDIVRKLAVVSDGSLYIGFASSSDTIHFDGYPTEFYKQNGTIFIAKMRASAVVGVEAIPVEANNPKIDIFPNPSSDFFTIDTPLAYDRIDITNSIGQVLQTEYTTEPKYIYTNTLANGIYFVSIYHKNQRIGTKKMVLQR